MAPLTTTSGGFCTSTLNHLVGPGPVKEWLDAFAEEDALIERLKKVSAERARHELAMRIAGVPRETLLTALAEFKQTTSPATTVSV